MDTPLDHSANEEPAGLCPQDEATIRAALERSRQDIADGRIKPLGPVLDRLRAIAKKLQQDAASKD